MAEPPRPLQPGPPQLIDGTGRSLRCSDRENSELFRYALGGLGQVGFIKKVVLRTVPYQPVTRAARVEHTGLADLTEFMMNGVQEPWVSSGISEAKRVLRELLEACAEAKGRQGRPYLYGTHDFDTDLLESFYGAPALERLRELREQHALTHFARRAFGEVAP
ncbi:hypothetical protein OTB20_27485 [Streptomyces sp. H27-H1]|uniref:hypothetical protein n=1 Tax=Streptomyces sp. H27-H1 TaxID=2996461 RepID=UPI002271D855|nr:hypothetical protein [Streptomyces sp. H27-H1]MCY0929867.1 hypothetical protein [Streptomyces sp. H27-H1]